MVASLEARSFFYIKAQNNLSGDFSMKLTLSKSKLSVLKAVFAAAVLVGLVACGGGADPLTVTVKGF